MVNEVQKKYRNSKEDLIETNKYLVRKVATLEQRIQTFIGTVKVVLQTNELGSLGTDCQRCNQPIIESDNQEEKYWYAVAQRKGSVLLLYHAGCTKTCSECEGLNSPDWHWANDKLYCESCVKKIKSKKE